MSNPTQTVLITGASTGIGLAVADAFLSQGANLVLNSRDPDRLNEAFETLGKPENTVLVAGDIAEKETAHHIVSAAIQKFGRIDVLVNNAGIFAPKPFLEVEEDELDRYYAVNLKGTYFASQAAIPVMKKLGGGSIINIGTVLVNHAIGGFPASAAVASKGALHALTRQLAAEFGKDNIRVNTVAPGIVRTPIHAKNGIDNVDDLKGLALLDRVGEGKEAAEAIVHLAAAEFTSGTTYALDGGWQAGHHLG